MHHRAKRRMAAKAVTLLTVIVFLSAVYILGRPSPRASSPTSSAPIAKSAAPSYPGFNKAQYPLDKADSLWVVVNKGRILPAAYVPANLVAPDVPLNGSSASDNMHLRQDAASALAIMAKAADTEGVHLMLISGYRSYYTQKSVYDGYVAGQGQAAADASSARPGHSEHQTGLAADLGVVGGACQLDQCFGQTPAGQWLASKAYRYGFVVRYPAGKEALTGYEYEPWHVRYVGTALATQLYGNGQILEQFFGLPAYSSYPPAGVQIGR